MPISTNFLWEFHLCISFTEVNSARGIYSHKTNFSYLSIDKNKQARSVLHKSRARARGVVKKIVVEDEIGRSVKEIFASSILIFVITNKFKFQIWIFPCVQFTIPFSVIHVYPCESLISFRLIRCSFISSSSTSKSWPLPGNFHLALITFNVISRNTLTRPHFF